MAARVLRGNVVLPDGVREGGVVVVEDGVIAAVAGDDAPYTGADDLGAGYIAPGLVDLHTHGIAGADTMDATSASLSLMARRYAAHGVTSFLPTTMTQSAENTLAAIQAVRAYMAAQDAGEMPGARAVGLHLEGPWLSREYKGAQNELYMTPPDAASVERYLDAGADALIKVSLAPELPGAGAAITELRRHGIYVSIAHTAATYDDVKRAVELGATHVTHCFNAMSPLHHRQPGVAGAALLHDDLYAELIADGVHVHPAVMRLLVRVKGRERVMLITDSMSATELSDGDYALGGQAVHVREGQARLESGSLAGSTLTLDRAVRNMVDLCGVPLHDAVYMATTVPSAAIGLGGRKGQLRAGYDADLALFDTNMQPIRTLIAGRVVWDIGTRAVRHAHLTDRMDPLASDAGQTAAT